MAVCFMAVTFVFQLSNLIKHPRGHGKHQVKKIPGCTPEQLQYYITFQF